MYAPYQNVLDAAYSNSTLGNLVVYRILVGAKLGHSNMVGACIWGMVGAGLGQKRLGQGIEAWLGHA